MEGEVGGMGDDDDDEGLNGFHVRSTPVYTNLKHSS